MRLTDEIDEYGETTTVILLCVNSVYLKEYAQPKVNEEMLQRFGTTWRNIKQTATMGFTRRFCSTTASRGKDSNLPINGESNPVCTIYPMSRQKKFYGTVSSAEFGRSLSGRKL